MHKGSYHSIVLNASPSATSDMVCGYLIRYIEDGGHSDEGMPLNSGSIAHVGGSVVGLIRLSYSSPPLAGGLIGCCLKHLRLFDKM